MNPLLYKIKTSIFSGETHTILFLGDSTTSTEWVFPSWRSIFEYVLKLHLEDSKAGWNLSWWNLKFINSSLDGSTTKDILGRIDSDILKYEPNLFVGLFGDNDIDKFSEVEHGENTRNIIRKLSANIDDVIYSPGITTANEYHNGRYKDYIAEEKVDSIKLPNIHSLNMFEKYKSFDHKKFYTNLLPQHEKFLNDGKGGNFDAFHPNPLGNAYMAKILLEEIFDISFDPEKFMEGVRDDTVKYPQWQ
ncbi:MAG: GDSL-type esterase/lipase family protein [Candidatus Dojkabacteria bacterium]|nr:GDSL-type esterase/lipase family protein [Candidatus Dojkabacteria bacterium]MDQ7020639.1 GDSL-type esterase/lipase family protein [Candidatus Dojkabacteria bacterium]